MAPNSYAERSVIVTIRTVVWLKSVEYELESIWLASARSQAITQASHEIDRDLRKNAESFGTALSEGLFVIERRPLRAVFEIHDGDRQIIVLSLSVLRIH